MNKGKYAKNKILKKRQKQLIKSSKSLLKSVISSIKYSLLNSNSSIIHVHEFGRYNTEAILPILKSKAVDKPINKIDKYYEIDSKLVEELLSTAEVDSEHAVWLYNDLMQGLYVFEKLKKKFPYLQFKLLLSYNPSYFNDNLKVCVEYTLTF